MMRGHYKLYHNENAMVHKEIFLTTLKPLLRSLLPRICREDLVFACAVRT